LLRGAGVQFNRINGPGTQQGPGNYNGVMIARINTDIALANFEAAVRNLVSDVEIAYWELYFDYRSLEAVTAGRDSALATWRKIETLYRVGGRGGELDREAQARAQYYLFQSSVETSLNALYAAESKLRYLMGLASTDGRLIRPKDEPTTAKVTFDWNDVKAEGLVRSVELRQQKWIVKRRELELIASKNFLLPQLDAVGQYRWLGMGNNLFEMSDGTGGDFTKDGSDAYHSLTSGQFQDWQAGFQLSMPLGYRKEHAGVRNAQLNVAKERAKLTEGELELTNQLAAAIRDLETTYVLTQTNWNRRIATQRQVEAVEQAYLTDTVAIDVLLKAQQERAQAESDYFRTLVNYNKSISMVHFRKGSLLEYNGVYLAEGPWPGKAYFDARRRARARGASTHFDYGFTQPRVISRGPYEQHAGAGRNQIFDNSEIENAAPTPAPQSEQELVPTPSPDATQSTTVPNMPLPPEPQASTSGAAKARVQSGPKSANRSTTDKVGQASAAKQTSGSSSSKVGLASQNEAEVTSVGPSIDGTNTYESGTYPSTAATHQPASGWTGVQH
jgi:outer membrane protein TolC